MAWAEDHDVARRLLLERWPTSGLPGQLLQELRTPRLFEEAVSVLPDEHVLEETPLGPDPKPYLEAIQAHADLGYDEVYLTQVGTDQRGFLAFCLTDLIPRLPRSLRPRP